jgi:hypothetical protein
MPTNTFLSLTNADLGLHSQQIQGVVYAPGLVCTRCLHPGNQAVVVSNWRRLDLLGENCVEDESPKPWLKSLATAKYFTSLSDIIIDRALPLRDRKHFRSAALYNQIYPRQDFAANILARYRRGELISGGQFDENLTVAELLGEPNDLLAQRDQLTRLAMLARLGEQLGNRVASKVSGLSDVVRKQGLTSKQNQMVWAIQNDYSEEMLPYTYQFLSHWPPKNGIISLD